MIGENETLASVTPSSSARARRISIWERFNSPLVWLLLVAYLGLATVMVTVIFPVEFLDRTQAGFFELQAILAMGAIGMIGVWMSMVTGFPGAWDKKVTNKQRLLIPGIAGMLFGALFLATDLITGLSRLQQERFDLPAVDIAFPASIFVYSAGSIYLEVVYRLFTIPLLLGLISIVIRSQKIRESVFWALAVLTSLIEPLTQSPGTQVLPPLGFSFVLAQTFGFNLLQAAFFRKYGFLAAILARIAFYIMSHIIGSLLK